MTDDNTGLTILTDDEMRRHVRIMLEGTGHRGPQTWPLEGLDDDVYQEIERRVAACAELRRTLDGLLDAEMQRRRAADPTTRDVGEYADAGQSWTDEDAEREYDAALDRWRSAMTAWVEGK